MAFGAALVAGALVLEAGPAIGALLSGGPVYRIVRGLAFGTSVPLFGLYICYVGVRSGQPRKVDIAKDAEGTDEGV